MGPGVWEELAFKDFSIFSSGCHLVYWREKILAILLGSHLGNISTQFKSHWPKGSGGELLKQIFHDFLFLALAAICSSERNRFDYFGRGSPKQHSYEV